MKFYVVREAADSILRGRRMKRLYHAARAGTRRLFRQMGVAHAAGVSSREFHMGVPWASVQADRGWRAFHRRMAKSGRVDKTGTTMRVVWPAYHAAQAFGKHAQAQTIRKQIPSLAHAKRDPLVGAARRDLLRRARATLSSARKHHKKMRKLP